MSSNGMTGKAGPNAGRAELVSAADTDATSASFPCADTAATSAALRTHAETGRAGLVPAMVRTLLSAVTSIALLVVATSAAIPALASTFSVTGSGSTFTITRSGDTSAAETVRGHFNNWADDCPLTGTIG